MELMLQSEVSRHLLLAYAYAARHVSASEFGSPQDQLDAETNLFQGTNILWNRLQIPELASSDANVQAVLLLVAYTADFGQTSEVNIHVEALRTMMIQRGGVEAFGHNPALQQQLRAVPVSRRMHLTLGCSDQCAEAVRGLRLDGQEIEGDNGSSV
jgi:hypothetical protein